MKCGILPFQAALPLVVIWSLTPVMSIKRVVWASCFKNNAWLNGRPALSWEKNALYNWTKIEALQGVDLSYLGLLTFIATIAASVQLVEMVIDRYSPSLYNSLGVFLPLITVNCAILGSTIFMRERSYNLVEATVFGFGSGLGFALAIVSMAAIRYKLRYSNIPDGLKGLGITMVLTGLISLAYLAFSGVQL